MSTIIPYFDPILGKLRNSDVALISVASLIVSDPLIVNNLQVLSNASVNQLHTNSIYNVSTISTNGLGLNYAQWNSNTSLGPLEGLMNWSSLYGTIQLGLAGGNVDVPLGLTTNLPKRVRNSTGSTMPKGTAVYLNGVSGNTPLVERALATGDRTSAFTIGMTAEDIANNATGWVTSFGLIRGIDTSSFTSGDTLYLSGATAGYYTNVPTKTPVHYVRVGTVTKASADGEIIVNVINGYELDELHNVVISSLASGQILQSGASSYWYNRSLASAIAENISFLSLGSLAVMNQLSYASLTGKPSLGSLAEMNALSYGSILNLPSLGSLAEMNALSFTSLLNQPSLSSLAFQATIDYTSAQLTNKPSLGSLAQMNQLSFTSLTNQPSLSSLAFQSTIDYTSNQLTNKPSLGSLAIMNQLAYGSLLSTPSLNGEYLRLDLFNTPLTGSTLDFNNTTNKVINVNRTTTAATAGRQLSVVAGGAVSGGTNLAGGDLVLSSGIATGNNGSGIKFLTAAPGTSGTTDRNPNQKMIVAGNGNVGIGVGTPNFKLHVIGDGFFTSDITANNLSGTNTGDQTMAHYGDGIDGTVVLNGTEYPSITTYDSGTGTYTLLRDIFTESLVIDAGYFLNPVGYRIFARPQITINGTIQNNGGNGSGTTAGTGGIGNFFRAGGNGATGLGTAAVAGTGTAIPTPTANTFVNGLGGRGGTGRSGITAQVGGSILSSNLTSPANADGGARVTSNIVNYLNKFVVGATNWQMTTSTGGGAGAKSATGTTAVSGGGGGGGGLIFIAAPSISGNGLVSVKGGDGGNASGTGGSFGGGGGGGVGLIVYATKNLSFTGTSDVSGGLGGTSVIGTNGSQPIGLANGTNTGTGQVITVTPSATISVGSLVMIAVHIQNTGGVAGVGINSITGYGMAFNQVSGTRVEFNSIASPTRVMELWYGVFNNLSPDLADDKSFKITLSQTVTNCRVTIDEIFNTNLMQNQDPVTANSANNRVDAALTLTVTLPTAPTAGNLVYSAFARTVTTGLAAGAGNTLFNNQTAAPNISTQGSIAQQANAQTHTTTNGAIAGISVEITDISVNSRGQDGWAGRVIRLYG